MEEYEQDASKSLRQKAISLLYLLFIAMVFIYVPSDFLDSLTDAEHSMDQTSAELNQLKKKKFFMYEDKNSAVNYKSVIDSFKYRNITLLSDSAVNYIETVKQKLLSLTGGKNVFSYPLKGKDFDATDHLMIGGKEAEKLKVKLMEYRSNILLHLTDNQKSILDSILVIQEDKLSSAGKKISWEDYFFRKTPLSASLMMLSKFQTEIRLVEYLVLDKYERDFIQEVFIENGNRLESIANNLGSDSSRVKLLMPKSTYVVGEEVTMLANISKSKNDSDKALKVFVKEGNQTKPIEIDKDGFIRYYPEKEGKLTISAEIGNVKTEATVSIVRPKPDLTKKEPEVLYVGIKNPLRVSYVNHSLESLRVRVSMGTVRRFDSLYYVQCDKTGLMQVLVEANVGNKYVEVSKRFFQVKELPLPFAVIDNQRGGNLSLSKFRDQRKVEIKSDLFELVNYYNIKEFNVLRVGQNGMIVNKSYNRGAAFNPTSLQIIEQAQKGDIYIINDIKVIGNDGNIKDLPAAVFNIS